MSSSEYQRALDFLFARTTGGVRFGLDRTLALLDALGNPHRAIPCFHVAGTNGKGSTVASIAAMLKYKGMRVATYTSPHLIDFRERIVVDGLPIGEEEVVRFIRDHLALIEQLGATFFEATTAMAFDHIARSGAEVSVIETGLGGRLDSTNVIDPLSAIVTSIGLDHTDLLGDTIEAIAQEKAGIFKRGRPAIIGDMGVFDTVAATLNASAALAGASPIRSLNREIDFHWVDSGMKWDSSAVGFQGTEFEAEVNGKLIQARTGLIGRHQASNAMTAWMALDSAGDRYAMPLDHISSALEHLIVPGRFHRVGNVVFDVAHNPDGFERLINELHLLRAPHPIKALIGILSDKDWRSMLTSTANGVVDEVIVTIPPTAPVERRWNLAEVTRFADEWRPNLIGAPAEHRKIFKNHRINLRAIPDFDGALREATSDAGTTLITGSFHTVGDAMARLQVNPLAG
jgi:dihydrofolate synthase / folylpolyglutamate synthase